jgi:HEAT repeat protein
MFEKKGSSVVAFVTTILIVTSTGLCGELDDNWNDFLHYTAIGRLDLAKGYAQKIIDSEPDPIALLALSEENTNGYRILLKMNDSSAELREVSGMILDIIEQGRYYRRTDPRIIVQEIKRLGGTIRGRIAAEQRLKNAGEYSIPYMLDVLLDMDRQDEFANVAAALPKVGRDAIRPLVAALATDNVAVKAEIIRALGDIGYPQSLSYLKYIVENDKSNQFRNLAVQAINKIDSGTGRLPAAELLYQLAGRYYSHSPSLAPAGDYDYANIWFWDEETLRLEREEVSKSYFNELMSMRACEWSLKADENLGKSIALWIAAFFKMESYGVDQPEYFGQKHLDAMAYARTAGPEYLHQALDIAIRENNSFVALGVVEALAANAGEKSLLYRIGLAQPLVKALSFNDRAVRYSAAIAIGAAGPGSEFVGSKLIIENLAEAIGESGTDELGTELADIYAIRAISVMLDLAISRNRIVDLTRAMPALITATKDPRKDMQILAGEVLARIESPDAQQAIAQMGLSENNDLEVRIAAFESLAVSAKLHANLLTAEMIDGIYSIVGSATAETVLRSTAASAYGSLNLPSRRVKDLILDQAVN